MKKLWTWIILLITGVALLAPANTALAAKGISDNGNFFSAATEQKATGIINDLATKHHGEEVYVETQQAIPDGTTYADYADQRTRASNVRGVYILIIRKGGHVHVAASQQTERLFTNDVRAQLAKQIEGDLRQGQKNFENALLNALSFVSDTFDRGERQPGGTAAPKTSTVPPVIPRTNNPPPSRTTGSSFFSGIWGWVCLAAGIWVIVSIVRNIFVRKVGGYGGGGPGYGGGGPGYGGGGGGPGYGGGYGGGGYGGGGGGWGSSILGGLFGAAAGSWLYDRFAHGGGSAYGQPPVQGGGYTDPGPSQPDWAGPSTTSQGYESSDAGGGADFGSGGGGGSDFGGGGDSGGGADFGGGGGGDFGGGGGGGGDAGGGGDFA